MVNAFSFQRSLSNGSLYVIELTLQTTILRRQQFDSATFCTTKYTKNTILIDSYGVDFIRAILANSSPKLD